MAWLKCSECGWEIPNNAWSCPGCGSPAEEAPTEQTGKEISTKGMLLLLLLFLFFPALLFLLHIFVPGM
jgi:hypothetical protein